MNLNATIAPSEYQARVDALRQIMAEKGVDLVVGFSNLLEIAIVRYYCGFAPVNESSAIVIPAEGDVIVLTAGVPIGTSGTTNLLRVWQIEQ